MVSFTSRLVYQPTIGLDSEMVWTMWKSEESVVVLGI
jgi:hypothetical protein